MMAALVGDLCAAEQKTMRGCKELRRHLPPSLSPSGRAFCGGTARRASQMRIKHPVRDAMQVQA